MAANAPKLSRVLIRNMTEDDAVEAAELCSQLGYPAEAAEIAARLRELKTLNSHAVFVACVEAHVVGWIDVGIVSHLQSAPFGEIGGLVVSAHHRGSGIGSKLVEQAERWIASQNVNNVLVRSRSTRKKAHDFYLQHNYSLLKTSLVFTKSIDGNDESGSH